MKRTSRAQSLVERLETLLELDTYLHSGGKPFPSSESPTQGTGSSSSYTSKNYMDPGPIASPFRLPSATRTSNDVVRNSFPQGYATGRQSPAVFQDTDQEPRSNVPNNDPQDADDETPAYHRGS